jgi:hypothetical protein
MPGAPRRLPPASQGSRARQHIMACWFACGLVEGGAADEEGAVAPDLSLLASVACWHCRGERQECRAPHTRASPPYAAPLSQSVTALTRQAPDAAASGTGCPHLGSRRYPSDALPRRSGGTPCRSLPSLSVVAPCPSCRCCSGHLAREGIPGPQVQPLAAGSAVRSLPGRYRATCARRDRDITETEEKPTLCNSILCGRSSPVTGPAGSGAP